jgi:hypothetical protein
MATPAELYTQLQKLKTVTIQTGRAAIRNINPLTEVEALDTNLRLITVNESLALFWSKELGRPAFLISEGECDNSECSTQIQVSQFSPDILSAIKYQPSTLKFLIDLTNSEKLKEYINLLAQSKATEEAYQKSQWELRDKKEYDRLRQKFGPPAS